MTRDNFSTIIPFGVHQLLYVIDSSIANPNPPATLVLTVIVARFSFPKKIIRGLRCEGKTFPNLDFEETTFRRHAANSTRSQVPQCAKLMYRWRNSPPRRLKFDQIYTIPESGADGPAGPPKRHRGRTMLMRTSVREESKGNEALRQHHILATAPCI